LIREKFTCSEEPSRESMEGYFALRGKLDSRVTRVTRQGTIADCHDHVRCVTPGRHHAPRRPHVLLDHNERIRLLNTSESKLLVDFAFFMDHDSSEEYVETSDAEEREELERMRGNGGYSDGLLTMSNDYCRPPKRVKVSRVFPDILMDESENYSA
jgi:hypothetical protein